MGTYTGSQDPFKGPFRSLEELADRISDLLHCPVTIEDSNHRILAYSTHDENVDPARIATIMRRKVPENVIKTLWKNGVIPQLFESEEPVIIPAIEEVGLGKRVAISVRKNNEILGFIWAQVHWDVTDEELDLFKRAAKVVKNQMLQLQIKKRKSEEDHKEFFWQLLTDHLTDLETIQSQARKYHIQLEGPLAIVVFEFEEDIHQSLERHIHYYIEASRQVGIVCSAIDSNQLILLVRPHSSEAPGKEINDFVSAFVEKIQDRVNVEFLKGAAGTLYKNPVRIQDSYKEALHVLSIKDRFSHEVEGIYSYQDLGIYQFIDSLYEKRIRDHYTNQYIETLRAYDEKHRTELLETVSEFLRCDSNVNEAAKALHIHSNTLNYRLKRIANLTGFNFKDPNQKITLYLDLMIERLKQ
ncbi:MULTISPECIES: PucR family transcriptional regulator [Pontibacillus]|uniref:Helix-turn-helix domain-containing protein n=1 Tax=Pontibacillus chungwhensis TaxID=265426 RepID=A0ABY8UV22_9BACI|nr:MULTISPECIES: helix-turn-helix domain-containing protein [Pontibacillus]MCD5325270.1 helix-turn-helix domain-containing protein [Pontibacillus sp. HN14]WIF97515.1 helix-turn-helix domain-containing protein [Pontibacillus chungwhensis]